ncbi:methyltransferase [Clostridium sp. SM-530-WT-3G]|uniref:methyltransferase n=1 Tax=Clostridium sp. SM-530-WT-3G TaxID=2725303 RepID=UPI00145D8E90|nr:methyltransferase [Clostridium sp. SM-530-WT-3G]NME81825.1 methyltransferase [Clostridium sp. SM-530-WT-3G]
MTEQDYEKLLNIKTMGDQKVFYDSLHYHRYEPTSYKWLNVLCENYDFNSKDTVVDFGCGKGRLNFYLNYFFDCAVTGIEMNNYFIELCNDNKTSYLKKTKKSSKNINFVNCLAQEYKVDKKDNKFYFFNPFSSQIFISVIENILDSVYENPRTVDLILYYSEDDYIYYLENYTCFELRKEIPMPILYEKDHRHKYVIYRMEFS